MPDKKSKGNYYRPKYNFDKSVKAVVKEELARELEEKHAIVQYDTIPISRNIPSGVVFNGQGNFFQIMPAIAQSTPSGTGRAYNERIGNEIILKKLKIRYFLNYVAPDALEVRPMDYKIGVRVMVLKCKEFGDVAKAFDAMPTDKLIRFGTYSGTSGPGPYAADPLDMQAEINRDVFTVRYDKLHTLTAPVSIDGTTSVDTVAPPSGLKFGEYDMTFGKSGLKLKFTDLNDEIANNFGYFIAVGYSSLSDPNKPANALAEMTLNCSASFTDA